jgi:ABC-type glutathione transport system ATPase component
LPELKNEAPQVWLLMVLLRAENLCVEDRRHGQQRPVLRAINFKIMANQITVLLGESGAGKTMLAKAFSGLLPEGFFVNRGFIAYREKRLAEPVSWLGIRGCKIFYSPQNAAASLNPVLTIGRQIRECSRIGEEQLLEMLAGMEFRDPLRIMRSYPFMLSGGENQRCLLAMALAGRAELLILDEPTAELDAGAQDELIRVLRTHQRQNGLAVLLISHHLDLIKSIAENLYVMCAGEIVDSGIPAAVFRAPGHPYTREIGAYLDNR